jgi:DNA-directed RNA polymerase specialized sigma24 family protein
MTRYCAGDADAARDLYRLVAPPLYDELVERCRHADVAAAVLNRTFLEVHRWRRVYIAGADPTPWIYAIAERIVAEHH